MNEGGNGAGAPQAQGQNTAQLTSAINTGFDASKFGSGKKQKPEKVKKVREKKSKETKKNIQSSQNRLDGKTKRPLWFWIVLGILGVAIAGAVIWMIVSLMNNEDNNVLTDLVLEGNHESSSDGGSVTQRYVDQLNQIYEENKNVAIQKGSSEDDADVAGKQVVSNATEQALGTTQGKNQADSIRLAEMIFANQETDYDRLQELVDKVNPDNLALKERASYYAIARLVYRRRGDSTKEQDAFAKETQLIEQICSLEECAQ